MQLHFATLRHVTFTLCYFTLCSNIMRAVRGEGSLDRKKRQQKQWASSFTPSDVPSEMQIMLHNVQTA